MDILVPLQEEHALGGEELNDWNENSLKAVSGQSGTYGL